MLQITSQAVTISAATEAGLFYGVQTLRQLLRTHGGRIPALTIRDRPVLAHRGLMLDVSRGKVPTLATLLALVDGLAAHKYNQLQLYVEHTFDFPSHPAIGAGTDPLTAEDILVLDEYCRARHVELVPNLQSFGHQRHLLSLPQYSHLDEVGWRWSLTPAREETYGLLDDLYADFLPAFSSDWLNVDCDETWDLGTGQSKALAAELGKGSAVPATHPAAAGARGQARSAHHAVGRRLAPLSRAGAGAARRRALARLGVRGRRPVPDDRGAREIGPRVLGVPGHVVLEHAVSAPRQRAWEIFAASCATVSTPAPRACS